jgi:hypothetical protein
MVLTLEAIWLHFQFLMLLSLETHFSQAFLVIDGLYDLVMAKILFKKVYSGNGMDHSSATNPAKAFFSINTTAGAHNQQ